MSLDTPFERANTSETSSVIARVRGSHYILRHPERSGIRITVPAHTRDLKPKTLATIIKQAGLTADTFRDLL